MGHPHLRGRKIWRDNLVTVTSFAFGAALCILLGSPLYWRVVGDASDGAVEPCPPCVCDCVNAESEGSLYEDLADLKGFVLPNCGKDDPDMQEELKKSGIQLLQEELELHEVVSTEARERINAVINHSISKGNEHFKESQRCEREMLVLEDARERAESDLGMQRKTTKLWESRARALGWKVDEEERDTFKSSSKEDGLQLENRNTGAGVENAESTHFPQQVDGNA